MPAQMLPMQDAPEPEITMTMPRATFDMARQFVKAFGQVLDAADAAAKASEKAQGAQANMAEAIPTDALAGLGDELNAASNSQMGLPQL